MEHVHHRQENLEKQNGGQTTVMNTKAHPQQEKHTARHSLRQHWRNWLRSPQTSGLPWTISCPQLAPCRCRASRRKQWLLSAGACHLRPHPPSSSEPRRSSTSSRCCSPAWWSPVCWLLPQHQNRTHPTKSMPCSVSRSITFKYMRCLLSSSFTYLWVCLAEVGLFS